MTILQQLIERFIRTNTPFNITVSTNYTLYVDPSKQEDYDGTSLRAQTGFPNIKVSVPALVNLYDTKLIKKTSFETPEERLNEIDRILAESGFNYSHRQSKPLIEELSNYLDELNNQNNQDIDYHTMKLSEINGIGIYGDDLFSMYNIWNKGFDFLLKSTRAKYPLDINDNLGLNKLVDNIFRFTLEHFDWYFKIDLDIVKASNALTTKKEVNFYINKFSTKWAREYKIEGDYLILYDYEVNENELIEHLIIPIKAISVFGYLRASGGVYSQMAHSPKVMPERVRMQKMYIRSTVDISYNSVQETLLEKDKQFIQSFLKKQH